MVVGNFLIEEIDGVAHDITCDTNLFFPCLLGRESYPCRVETDGRIVLFLDVWDDDRIVA